MSPLIALNGQDIRGYGLRPLEGTIATLITPAKYKKMVSNDSSFVHGTLLLCSPDARKYDKRDISLSFYIQTPSQMDLKREIDNLVQLLVKGVKDNEGEHDTGVNLFSLPDYGICLRLVFQEVSKVTPWLPKNNAVITIKFTEPNPNNRTLPTVE